MPNFTRIFAILAVLLTVGCAAPASSVNSTPAATDAGNAVAAADSSVDDPNELICRREQVTGTNFRRRVCLTRAQREQERSDSQEEMLERRSAVR